MTLPAGWTRGSQKSITRNPSTLRPSSKDLTSAWRCSLFLHVHKIGTKHKILASENSQHSSWCKLVVLSCVQRNLCLGVCRIFQHLVYCQHDNMAKHLTMRWKKAYSSCHSLAACRGPFRHRYMNVRPFDASWEQIFLTRFVRNLQMALRVFPSLRFLNLYPSMAWALCVVVCRFVSLFETFKKHLSHDLRVVNSWCHVVLGVTVEILDRACTGWCGLDEKFDLLRTGRFSCTLRVTGVMANNGLLRSIGSNNALLRSIMIWIWSWLVWLGTFEMLHNLSLWSLSNFWTQFSLPITPQRNLWRKPRWCIFFFVFDFSSFHPNNVWNTISRECFVTNDRVRSSLIELESFLWARMMSTQYTVFWCLLHALCMCCAWRGASSQDLCVLCS